MIYERVFLMRTSDDRLGRRGDWSAVLHIPKIGENVRRTTALPCKGHVLRLVAHHNQCHLQAIVLLINQAIIAAHVITQNVEQYGRHCVSVKGARTCASSTAGLRVVLVFRMRGRPRSRALTPITVISTTRGTNHCGGRCRAIAGRALITQAAC